MHRTMHQALGVYFSSAPDGDDIVPLVDHVEQFLAY